MARRRASTKAQAAAVAAYLRTVRIEAGLTQRELGKKLKRPQSWVWNCETGHRRVNIVEFVEWCRACGVDPQEGFEEMLEGSSGF